MMNPMPEPLTKPAKPKGKRGGRRPGAGRPKGRTDAAVFIDRAAEALARKGARRQKLEAVEPLQLLELVMCNPAVPLPLRMNAAAMLAPYRHSKAPAISLDGQSDLRNQHLEAVKRVGSKGRRQDSDS